jgi:hypothetical protein
MDQSGEDAWTTSPAKRVSPIRPIVSRVFMQSGPKSQPIEIPQPVRQAVPTGAAPQIPTTFSIERSFQFVVRDWPGGKSGCGTSLPLEPMPAAQVELD